MTYPRGTPPLPWAWAEDQGSRITGPARTADLFLQAVAGGLERPGPRALTPPRPSRAVALSAVERFFIDSYGPNSEAELAGLMWLVGDARTRGTSGAVLVPGLNAIRSLDRTIGRQAANFAEKNRHFDVGGTRVEVYSERTKPSHFDGPVLVPWSNDARVNAAEEMRPPAICALPWAEDDLAEWKRAWNPRDPRTGEAVGQGQATVSSPLVERALLSLTQSVNMSTGITHPSDEQHAKRLLKALTLCGEPLDEMEIRTWAMSRGWEPRHAGDLGSLAGKIAAGRPVKGAAMNKTEAKQIVQRLRRSP